MDFGPVGFRGGVSVFEILFALMFALVIGMFIVNAIKGIRQWNINNHSSTLYISGICMFGGVDIK